MARHVFQGVHFFKKENGCPEAHWLLRAGNFGSSPKLPRKMRARNILGHLCVKIGEKSTRNAKVACHFFPGRAFFPREKKNLRHPEAHGLLGWPWLAWLSIASFRPRSPCLHHATMTPAAFGGRRGASRRGRCCWCRQGERGRSEAR